MNDELKPCPFCGSDDLEIYHEVVGCHYYVTCRDCGSSGAIYYTPEQAAHAWNRRANED